MWIRKFKILREQIKVLTVSNLKSRYRGTWTGFLWTIFNPLLMFGAQSYAFNYILKIKVQFYLFYLFSGLLPWLFITQTIDMGITSLINNGRILKSFPIHPMILICSAVAENFIHFLMAFSLIIIPAIFIINVPIISILFVTIAFLVLLLAVISLTSMAAILNTFFRDTKFIVQFIISISFFLTPVFYDQSIIPEEAKWIIQWNLLYYFILPFRYLFHTYDLDLFSNAIFKAGILDIFLMTTTYYLWKKKQNQLYAEF